MHKRKVVPSSDRETTTLPQLLTIAQVAELLNVGRSTVYELINEDGLPYVLVRGIKRVAPHSLQWWIGQQECSKSASINEYVRAKASEKIENASVSKTSQRRKKTRQ